MAPNQQNISNNQVVDHQVIMSSAIQSAVQAAIQVVAPDTSVTTQAAIKAAIGAAVPAAVSAVQGHTPVEPAAMPPVNSTQPLAPNARPSSPTSSRTDTHASIEPRPISSPEPINRQHDWHRSLQAPLTGSVYPSPKAAFEYPQTFTILRGYALVTQRSNKRKHETEVYKITIVAIEASPIKMRSMRMREDVRTPVREGPTANSVLYLHTSSGWEVGSLWFAIKTTTMSRHPQLEPIQASVGMLLGKSRNV